MADYLAARKDLRPTSVRVYRTCVDRYLEPWLDLPLRSINSEMVEERHRPSSGACTLAHGCRRLAA